jgi:prevent-host-death family protein
VNYIKTINLPDLDIVPTMVDGSSRGFSVPFTGLWERNMNAVAPFNTFSARDAKAKFGELLDEALGRPVGITKHDRLTAYVVSKRDFEQMLAKIEELQDQLWLTRAELARKEGFVGAEQVDALLSEVRNFENAEDRNNE